VYAHEELPRHFDRYLKTRGWTRAINMRQFAIYLPQFQWPDRYRYPDVTYKDAITFNRGELTFELRHARGETDDATWTWCPEKKILAPGDLFIWAVPNAGNPQKVQRYVGDWAVALREMAALGPEIMLAGHGLPIVGRDRIVAALTDTADLLQHIEDQTLALMNQGVTLDRVIHEVDVPEHLKDKPYLQPVYDHPQFIVRNVWRRYGGWWDGEPDNLLPSPRSQQAEVWVDLAGGLDNVLARAAELRASGELRLACHLVEYAVLAQPDSSEAHALRREIYAERSATQVSSMARNILNHASLASEQGKRDMAGE
jgi:alkyl sulfatase BDS1-like metallo-beta-lactamase superfamily hydrolase